MISWERPVVNNSCLWSDCHYHYFSLTDCKKKGVGLVSEPISLTIDQAIINSEINPGTDLIVDELVVMAKKTANVRAWFIPRHFQLFLLASCDHHHSCPPVSSSAADVVTGKNMSSRVPATMTIKVSPVIQCCCNLARRKELEAIMQETNVFKK